MLNAHAHYETLHGGVELVLNIVRQTFWIVATEPHIKRFVSSKFSLHAAVITVKKQSS